jgi:hypothetical protein
MIPDIETSGEAQVQAATNESSRDASGKAISNHWDNLGTRMSRPRETKREKGAKQTRQQKHMKENNGHRNNIG